MSTDDPPTGRGVDEWRPRLLCLFGLTPFYAWYAATGSIVALIVVVNGVLFHLFFPSSSLVKNYDVGCNVCLALSVNAIARDPIVALNGDLERSFYTITIKPS